MRWRAAAMALAIALTAALPVLGPGASPGGAQPAPGSTGPELVDQTVVVRAGEPFTIAFSAGDLDPAEPLRLRIHERIRTRSELARAIDGDGLRGARSTVAVDLAALPPRPDGALELTLATDGQAGGISLGQPGVYPVTLTGADGGGSPLRLVTQLVVPPPEASGSPSLDVALLADLGLSPSAGVDEPLPLDPDEVAGLRALLDGLHAFDALTVVPRPETLLALARSTDPDAAELLDQVRLLAGAHPVLESPFVPVSPDALAGAGLGAELDRQLLAGAAVRQGILPDATVLSSTWVASAPLGPDGLDRLERGEIQRLVVHADHLAAGVDGVLSLARPFRAVPPRVRGQAAPDTELEALVVDGPIAERLRDDAGVAAGVAAVAELAALWFEQPTVARAAVVQVDRRTPAAALSLLARVVTREGWLRSVDLGTAFLDADPLTDRAGRLRPLELARDVDLPTLDARIADGVTGVRSQLTSLATMLADDDPVLQEVEAEVLRAEAVDLAAAVRRSHLDDARTRIGRIVGGVTTTGTETVTLTARSGSLPITLVNDTSSQLSVVLHLRSTKLEVPDGTDIQVDLPPGTTRVDLEIRTRASGSIPLELVVTSPDGALLLTTARYSVQSTAVSGVGVVLSVGALLFLLLWWGRHWRDHRRAKKLVPPDDGA